MYNISIIPNKITITFNKLTNNSTILSILYYYINNNNCIIQKMLLSTQRSNVLWYNDITAFKNKPLLFFLFKIKDEFKDRDHISSHIIDSEFNHNATIEIFTINIENNQPILLNKNELIKKLFIEIENIL